MAEDCKVTFEGPFGRYLSGECAMFAIAVHELTGWPTVGIHAPGETGAPRHVMCLGPDGYVDARGDDLTAEEAMTFVPTVRPGHGFGIRPIESAEVRRRWRHRPPEQWDDARRDVTLALPGLASPIPEP